MSDFAFSLTSCTRALIGSESAVHLIEQKERVEQAVARKDAALTLDTAKALAESVFKTILADRVADPDLGQELSPLYRSVRSALPLNRDSRANEILTKLTNAIVHNLAELRNSFGAASHGADGYIENPIEMPEAEMVARIVDGMVGFLYVKHKTHGNPESAARIYYGEHPDFDDWLDNQWPEYTLPLRPGHPIKLPASKFLFITDTSLYREMLLQYRSTEAEDSSSD
jgi:hypothetical protein